MKNKDIKIVVATHKKYEMPKDDMYLPLEVGAACRTEHTGFQRDDVGENISEKNPGFCELTGLYWAWKNLDNDYIGLVHYRRYFGRKGLPFSNRISWVLNSKDLNEIMDKTDILLPKKRNYIIETLYNHYSHTMFSEPLDMTGEIIRKQYHDYYDEFLKLKNRRSAHMFNMLVMKREDFHNYCGWLFSVLFELEKKVDENGLKYTGFHSRFYGRISELLLDVYIRTRGLKYKEHPVISIEPVNWLKKGSAFVLAKCFRRKYEKSF